MKRKPSESFSLYRANLTLWAGAIKRYLKGTIMKGTVTYYTPKRSTRVRKTHRKYRWQLTKSKRIMQKMSRRKNRRK